MNTFLTWFVIIGFIMTTLLLISGNYLYKRTNGRVYLVFQIIGLFLLVLFATLALYLYSVGPE